MRHKPSFALIGSVVLFAATPAMAQNVPAQLTVTNTAQPGMESDVPPAAGVGPCARKL